jgi:3-oxoacid CoA-transferase A subunit
MPIDKRAGTAAEALADVADGATVFISGFGGAGFPNVLIRALRDRSPKQLTLECVPQGTFAERIRAGGAGIPAFYTPVGLGTELARGKEVRRFGDREYVLEQAIKGDLALVRADIADRYGNLTFRYAQMNFGPVMATAAARVVVEVRAVLEEPIPYERVQLPGLYVDRVVTVGA